PVFALRHGGDLLPGKGTLEQTQEIRRVGELRGGIDRRTAARELAFVEFRLQSAEAGSDHHAELAGAVQRDPHFGAAGSRSGIECEAESAKQLVQAVALEAVATLPGRLPE